MFTRKTQSSSTTGAKAAKQDDAGAAIWMVRQPVFERKKMEVIAYHVRLSQSKDDDSHQYDPAAAWAWLADSDGNHLSDMSTMSGGERVVIEINEALLIEEAYKILPPSATRLCLIGVISDEAAVVDACNQAKAAGYEMAIDGALCINGPREVLKLADHFSFDLALAKRNESRFAQERFDQYHAKLHARGVETRTDFDDAVHRGFCFFEGAFISEPKQMRDAKIPASKHNHIRFIEQINRDDVDFDELERIIKQDVSLSTGLLKLINSAACGVRETVSSIKQAMVLLGQRPLKQWATVIAMRKIAGDGPSELMNMALIRARFCEALAQETDLRDRQFDMFMMGLLSLVGAMVNCQLEDILELFPLPDDAKAAMVGEPSELKNAYDLAVSYEAGDFARITQIAKDAGIRTSRVPALYLQATSWADDCLKS